MPYRDARPHAAIRQRLARAVVVVDPITAVPNDLWTADFKGQFRTQDRIYCYPLTIADPHPRFLLTCRGLPSVHGGLARPVLARAFREYGLPSAMRTDHGAPFVTRPLCGLSALNGWCMRLGMQHQRIHPASPQENGAHERKHRTLKRGAIRPPRATARAQQRAFDAFRHEYPAHFLIKRVTDAGTIRFQTRLLFLANALDNYNVGLEEVDDGILSIFFGTHLLARFDERDGISRE